jgi:hypothetical protein
MINFCHKFCHKQQHECILKILTSAPGCDGAVVVQAAAAAVVVAVSVDARPRMLGHHQPRTSGTSGHRNLSSWTRTRVTR